MWIFIGTLATIVLFSFLDRYCIIDKKLEKAFYIILFVTLLGIMGLRSKNIGTDTNMYSNMFMLIGKQKTLFKANEVSDITAPVYIIFCRLIYKFLPYRWAWTFGCSAVIIIGVYRYILKFSNNIFFSVFLYMSLVFYIQSFNATRQFMAIGLVINAYTFWYNNKKDIRAWLLFLIAILIHPTAIVGIVGWILADKNDYSTSLNYGIIKSIVIGLLCVILQLNVIDVFIKIFPRYSMYLGTKAVHSFTDQGQGRMIIIILGYLAVIVYCIYLLSLKRNKGNNGIYYQLKIMLFAVVIGLFSSKSLALMRMNSYFTIIAISFIPNTLKLGKKQNRMILEVAAMILTATYMILFLIEDKSDVVPYHFFWEQVI